MGLLTQALSLDGRCKTFDASADGYGRGEGFAVAYLCPASRSSPPIAIMQVCHANCMSNGLFCTCKDMLQACRVCPQGLSQLPSLSGLTLQAHDVIQVPVQVALVLPRGRR